MKRRGRPPYPDILTPREQEVLALLRGGLSNHQIAARLDLSLAGAKYHVSEILSKLGVSTREEAARWRGDERRWWLATFAPFDNLRHRFAWLPQAALGATAVTLGAAAALLIWGLMRTDGEEQALSGAFSLPFCEVDVPASWQAAIDAATIPVPESVSFQAAAVAPGATQAFGAYYSPAWSGVAAIDPKGTITRISPFKAPDNDSIWDAAFNGRWLAWTERHSSATFGASDLYVWDSAANEVTI
jgi:DNA-binding CsgD family transcriptional regulator